jgi:hypothetical protein
MYVSEYDGLGDGVVMGKTRKAHRLLESKPRETWALKTEKERKDTALTFSLLEGQELGGIFQVLCKW